MNAPLPSKDASELQTTFVAITLAQTEESQGMLKGALRMVDI